MKNIYTYLICTLLSAPLWANENDSILSLKPAEYELDCDACGCSVSSGSSSLENLLYANYIGVKYVHQYYRAQENLFAKDLNEKQTFNTVQLWARVPISKQIEVFGSLPYHSHQKKGKNETKINGVGDMNLMGIYKLILPNASVEKMVKHQLSAGLGIKIPLAKFDQTSTGTANPSFQLGTGSWDTQFALNYQLGYRKLAVQVGTDYTLKGENKKEYKFGDQWNQIVQVQAFLVKNEAMILLGKVGFQNELFYSNQEFNERLPKTKGDLQLLKFGIEGAYSKFSFGMEYYQPLASNLNADEIVMKNKMGVFLNYAL